MAIDTRFGLKLPDATEVSAKHFIAEVLDPQIDELNAQLSHLQNLRRVMASTFGVDRREGGSKFAEAHDRARRAEMEGGDTTADGRLKLGQPQ